MPLARFCANFSRTFLSCRGQCDAAGRNRYDMVKRPVTSLTIKARVFCDGTPLDERPRSFALEDVCDIIYPSSPMPYCEARLANERFSNLSLRKVTCPDVLP